MVQINDFHFDCFLENCVNALRAANADSDCIDECTVLMEMQRLGVVSKEARNHDVRKTMERANKKSLFESLGGESNIAKIIEASYEKALKDDRVRSFFEKNKAKVASIKKKMTQFLCGVTGGNSNYDVADMRVNHNAMNITDFHFDAFVEVISDVCSNDLKIAKNLLKDLLKLLQPCRADITTGFTVRTEMAKRSLEKGKDQLFQRLGKAEGLKKLIDVLYEIMLNDARIKTFLEGKVAKIKLGQTIFLTEFLGGPKTYKGRELPKIHATVGVTDYHFDAFLSDFFKAMTGMGLDEALMDEVLVTVESLRQGVLGRSQTAEDLAKSTVKNGKPLIERLGGDMNLETIIETMYDKSTEDTRTKFFFEKPKAKQRQIRSKMYQYLCGQFGGPVQYNAANLRPAHLNMNITDYHFDAVAERFAEACRELDVPHDDIEDAVVVLNKIRADITTGCTVRMELAMKKNKKDGKDQLYKRIGGSEGVETIMARAYECIERDKRINMFFEGSKLQAIRVSQTEYITGVLGGPATYKGPCLEDVHATLAINDYHLDCFLQNMQKGMRDTGADQETVDECTVLLEKQRRKIMKHHYEKMGYK